MTLQALADARYSSVEEFMAAMDASRAKPRNEANRDVLNYYRPLANHKGWYGAGCDTGHDVMRLLSNGWPAGQARLTELLNSFDTSNLIPVDRRRKLHRCDMGDNLDISAVYAGRFQTAWTTARRRTTHAPQKVDIVVNNIIRAMDNSNWLFWRGACAVALCDKLEAAGYMVRMVVGFGGHTMGVAEQLSCRVTVKDHDRPMDIATAAAVLVPGFLRYVGLNWVTGHAKNKINTGVCTVEKCRLEENEIFISHEVIDQSTAKRRATEIITELTQAAAA